MGAIYLDTSVLMALLCPEPETACVRLWFGRSDAADIVSSPWSRSELFSALSVKQRMRQLDQEKVIQARAKGLEILATTRCVDVVTADFDQAAAWCTDAASGLRAPDALHLAIAQRVGCNTLASFDFIMQQAARRIGIALMDFGVPESSNH
jgi:predicted nucleic acid-binding protein